MLFTIKRPTPTTVLYTISTRSAATTVAAKTRRIAVTTIRVVLGLLIALTFYQKLSSIFLTLSGTVPVILQTWPVGQLTTALAARLPWHYFLPGSLAVTWLVFRKAYTEESLLVIRGLGVQTSTSSPTYLSTASTRFIPTNMIQDIFIHEAFKGFEVKFFLAIIVEAEEDVVVVFPNTLPKRQMLEEVWRGARACLYEPKA